LGRRARCVDGGWGGAGAFSDGKLTLSTEVGGRLPDYVGEERARELIMTARAPWFENKQAG